jgi:hypothetical protein
LGVTGIDHQFRDVSGKNRRTARPQRFAKPCERSIASEDVQYAEARIGNVEGGGEALQKSGHAQAATVGTPLGSVVGGAAAAHCFILELPGGAGCRNLSFGVATSLFAEKGV